MARRALLLGVLLLVAALGLVFRNLYTEREAAQTAQTILTQLEQELPVLQATAIGGSVPYSATQLAEETEKELEEPPAPEPEQQPAPEMGEPSPVEETPPEFPGGEECIGILELPTLELKLPIFSRWDDWLATLAPCRYTGSLLEDNLVLAGHNYAAHFGSLHLLEPEDPVYFTDLDGNRHVYAVTQTETLSAGAVDEMTTGDWDLTLFTCTVGGAARVTVRCCRTNPAP